MASRMITELNSLGVDTNHTLERLAGNEAIYERFLVKFLKDENFNHLIASISADDKEGALQYSHTLKGVCGNLGMNELFQNMEEMVCISRNQKIGDIKILLQQSESIYNAICAAIARNIQV